MMAMALPISVLIAVVCGVAGLILSYYTDIATGDIFPMRLRGDSYFDLLDEWIDAGLELGDYPPRDEKIIRRSMTESLTENPAFEKLAGNVRFQELEERLRRNETKWEE